MRVPTLISVAILALSACAPIATAPPTAAATLTPLPPSPLPPTATLIPSSTPPPPTETPIPQPLLLRRRCGRDYVVRANGLIQLFYGGWGVIGPDLADQWSTALVVDLVIDGVATPGELQRPTNALPLNCIPPREDLIWLYYSTLLPGLSPGEHHISVTIRALRPLPDGSGPTFGPGAILEQTFIVTAR